MASRLFQIPILMVLIGVMIATTACSDRAALTGRLVLRFHAVVGEDALQLGQMRYANPGGEGSFKIRDFQFFISNIRLVSESAEFVEPESYHLVRFDSDDGSYVLVIDDIPREDYRRIEFGLGVDPETNGTIASVGELDPNGRMAWSWDVGYKFVLVEGALIVGDTQYPLVYHVGFNESYRQLSFELAEPLFDGPEARIEFHADLLQMFNGATTVDMADLSNVKFDPDDARLLADNYTNMVSTCSSSCDR